MLLGNHRDSWVFGAVDPSSGTAVMKEVSRVMGQLVKSGKCHMQAVAVYIVFNVKHLFNKNQNKTKIQSNLNKPLLLKVFVEFLSVVFSTERHYIDSWREWS